MSFASIQNRSELMSSKLLCFPDLRNHGVLIGRRQLDRLEAAGKFPRRVHISERRVGWLAEEIDAHIAAKIANRCGAVTKVSISIEGGEEWRRARKNASQAVPERAA
jgi:predicted DNA-binding transcriptional regulator AlpA